MAAISSGVLWGLHGPGFAPSFSQKPRLGKASRSGRASRIGLGHARTARYEGAATATGGDGKAMDEEIFNMELRKFLKKVGVTSQREIETAVRDALDSGKLKGSETLKVKAVLTIEGLGLSHDIDGDIKLR